jgi:DNA replication protein DnaC
MSCWSGGTGKTHLAIAIARSCIRDGARGRFYNVVDLVNRLETETRNGRQVEQNRENKDRATAGLIEVVDEQALAAWDA